MRQRQRDLKTVYLRAATENKDVEGSSWYTYGTATEIKATVQPAGGKVIAEIYGEKAGTMLTMRYTGPTAIKANDGICVYVASNANPDFKVKAKQPWDIGVYDLEAI